MTTTETMHDLGILSSDPHGHDGVVALRLRGVDEPQSYRATDGERLGIDGWINPDDVSRWSVQLRADAFAALPVAERQRRMLAGDGEG